VKFLKRKDLKNSFFELGIKKGDIVHVQSDIRRIGPVDAPLTFDGQCGFYFETLKEVVGDQGTISCCTAFENYGRYGATFEREKSPSLTDTLSEYIRLRKGSIRSIHPIVSVTSVGKKAKEISGGSHYEGFSYNSPWGELHRENAKILTLGMNADQGGTTFFHYIEHLYGVPYVYVKIFDHPVFSKGKKIKGPFSMSVRYLDYNIENTPVKVKNSMLKAKLARQCKIGRSYSWCANTKDIESHMMKLLDKDRWVMLKSPPKFEKGKIPFDSITGDLK